MANGKMLLAIGAALLLFGADRGVAQDKTQDRTQDKTQDKTQARDRDQLKDILRTEGKLSAQEVDSTTSDLDGYLKRGGTQEQFRAMVRSSLGEGCKGVCLCEAVRSMNQFMQRGESGAQAENRVRTMLQEQTRQQEQKKLAQNDQQRRDQLRERTRERTQEMDRERAREQSRERSGGSAPGSGTGSGAAGPAGGAGGGKGGK